MNKIDNYSLISSKAIIATNLITSSPIKRLIIALQNKDKLIDICYGKKRKTAIFYENSLVVITPYSIEKLQNLFNNENSR